MNVDAVCEKLKQIEGLDQSMLPQYCATIKKVTSMFPRWLETGLRAPVAGSVHGEHFVFSFSKTFSVETGKL